MQEKEHTENEDDVIVTGPTDSHILSQVPQDEKGLAEKAGHTEEISDVGWYQSPDDINERIQIYYVKAVPDTPLQRLDLIRAEDEQFSPDKLRATLERFYTTIFVSLTGFVKHIVRLRSWRETQRTSIFCTVYFTAWLLDLLVPTFICVLLALTVYPPARPMLFPPAPIALVDSSTGGVQKPKAGVLGSHDSLTGAPEKMKGEAAEQEARNLMTGISSVVVGSVAGKHDQGTPEGAPMESSVPDAMDIVSKTADAQTAAHGEVPTETHDKTKQPMMTTVLDGANLSMRVLSDITDTYERLGNALSPTPPFSSKTPFVRLGSVLVAALAVSLVTTNHFFVKTSTFVFGAVFFGDPIFARAIAYLNTNFPGWQASLLPQNSVLKGIPTNAQLTLTLLRIGEANTAPLPPPPRYPLEKAPSQPASLHPSEVNLAASSEEISQAASPEPDLHPSEQEEHHETQKPKSWASRVLDFFRGTTATGIESKLAIDRVRAAAGSKHAKTRVGVLRRKGRLTLPSGPVHFDARYKGKRGAAVIDSSSEPPVLYFTTDPAVDPSDHRLERRDKASVLFTIPVTDIREMRKIGGLGWKGKLVTGWAVGSKEVVDGLVIVGKEPDQTYQLTAMRMRNQLFNRLVAIDGQVWK
ncbi:hypothetical protein ATEIFO6365_0011041900 [Aspergillus terreus]|uniref:Uncharacterized protein n=1 Tax=Aspergillus terreus TaxID=33178 RepID=A0A5M3Z3J5_ASPTE|nr:hypothetical protein ATETN484_0006056100 [Aspergillus terreus]GFF20157.1 hypothetical protein ATEIFO6365_0011041900 [Aspergillus terreus]